MRCVALLSGGKDSVAAIHVARQWGWEVVVALTMVPAEDDAWMFHTPNLDVTDGVAACLDLPLVKAPCREDPEEEVVDLQAALANIQQEYGVEAIVSGALASEYQRTRIDRIGHALKLKTFAPLWHKEPHAYMAWLVEAGFDIRFARVAADGFGPEWAGRRLDGEALQEIASMSSRPHVAGEGGEFETLVLDGPGFSSCIVVDEADVEASASRATWHVRKWHASGKTTV